MTNNYHEIKCDLTDIYIDYIAHQCNCTSLYGAGLSKVISETYPYANPYKHRKPEKNGFNRARYEDIDIPGTIKVFKCGKFQNKASIISMFAQYNPGNPKTFYDTSNARIKWFAECLDKISELFKDKKVEIAFPKNIGCGLAGGDWNIYSKMLKSFAEQNPNVNVWICEK